MASIWFEDFNMAYDTYKHGSKLKMKVEQLLPYLHGKSYCDIGCGGGDLVACIKELHPRFTSYTGIDVLDWRTESLKNVINFQMLDFSDPGAVSPVKYDLATCMAVLHHVGHDDRSRKLFLRNVRKAIAENGRLVVEEDVILPGEELEANAHYRLQVAKRISAQPYFQEYTALSMEEQRCVLTIIDLLANSLIVGVPDMAFPFGFKTINGWTNLFYECGFAVEMVQIKGFTPGMFNQSAHVHFILARN
jgi:SAM-dependent methyltransferase